MEGIQYIIENNKTGKLFDPTSLKSLQEVYLKLFNDICLQEKIINNAYLKVKSSYEWKAISKEMELFYQQVASNY